jgi:4-diphosphocytidyl-2-C-methyl-D-erythritol kinase
VNDLERPVFEKFVFLAQLKTWLLKQAEVGAAVMSGSGSTVFAVLRDHPDVDSSRRSQAKADLMAERAREELDREIWTCSAQTL